MTIEPVHVRPIDIGLMTTGDGATFADQTSAMTNGFGGNTSVFDIGLSGDGLVHAFDIEFVDVQKRRGDAFDTGRADAGCGRPRPSRTSRW